ncbi:hypothetical protein TTHERM_01093720 (macronuclear) [Tetrahymena thermophila SB210]|uniref:Uncharacterized protein n=1 Tax=Tetrahymena thermophila (strain SB210) TaxID=312017 RepID=Q22BM3_TETTS|nr:hypothetical protein TTHERM_01093720 [Tetrahymena thermophila SB210]EAR82706.1 hypothetical protein TTHERM_01093720 [Tetrahymena thermophila SB210]|eukprot:XP_001030369.1 hypothetical protein TTHERM_01093720 [Tetrahymena thermophila SB210]
MNKTGFFNKKQPIPNNSMKNTVGLLYSNLFRYQVTNKIRNFQDNKQEQQLSIKLNKSNSEQHFKSNQLNPSPFAKVKLNEESREMKLNLNQSDLSISRDNQQPKRFIFDQIKHTTNLGQTLVESQFGKSLKKFTNTDNSICQQQDDNKSDMQIGIDQIQEGSFDKQERSFFNTSYVGKIKKSASSLRDQKYYSKKVNKSNKKIESLNNDSKIKALVQQINQLNFQEDPIKEVQEVLQNVYNDEHAQDKGKRKQHLKELIFDPTSNSTKKRNKKKLQVKLSSENISSSSLNIEDDNEQQTQNQKKQKLKNQQKQQAVNLEGFRLHRSFSEEDQQQNQQNEQGQSSKNNNQENQGNKKKSGLIELLEKNQSNKAQNQFNNLYLDHYNRLGKEEWKTTKFQIGEFLWNARIDQLKASIKKKMPAYSTVLLKQWEDYEYLPNTYATKRNISQHREYTSPQNYKFSFKFYSPSSALANQNNTDTMSSQNLHDRPMKIDKISVDESLLKRQTKQNSPYSTLKSNISYERNLLSTAQSDYQQIYQTQPKYEMSKRDIQFKPSMSTKALDGKNYQKEFLQAQGKLRTRQDELKRIVQQIHDFEQVTKNQPVIPTQLIDLAKKQSQTSFFQLQDIGKQKKTFRFFEKTPQYSTQVEVDDIQTLKQLKQRSNTYKTFRNHVRQYLTLQKD